MQASHMVIIPLITIEVLPANSKLRHSQSPPLPLIIALKRNQSLGMVPQKEHEQPDKKPLQYHKRAVASQWVL